MALALSPGTPAEEARTAAMAALKLISTHRLLDPPAAAPPPAPQTRSRTTTRGRVVVIDGDLSGLSSDQVRRTLEDLFDFGVKAPEHSVASETHYPTHRVLRTASPCGGCGRKIPESSLVTVDLDDNGREVIWHRPCWERGKHG